LEKIAGKNRDAIGGRDWEVWGRSKDLLALVAPMKNILEICLDEWSITNK